MNFKLWLESTEEEYSNQLTNELCKFIKDNNRLPLAQNTPILGGHTSPAATRIGYNVEITELKLFQHLQELKDHIRFNSDKKILKAHDLENIVDKPMSKEEISKENLKKLADFYKANNRYPHYNVPEEKKLRNWLISKRQAKSGTGNTILYPDEEQEGIELGLPENWLDQQFKKTSEENLKKLADLYKANNRYPSFDIPEEKKLYHWWHKKRMAKKGMGDFALYPGEEELGISLGLPTDWLGSQTDYIKRRNRKVREENLKKLADFYKANNRYPSHNIPEEKKLRNWLFNKRTAKSGKGTSILYPDEEQKGIELGLPTDWLEFD